MENEKKLSGKATLKAAWAGLRVAVVSSPAFLFVIAIEEIVSRLAPFANAFILGKLVSTLPNVMDSEDARNDVVRYILMLAVVSVVPTILSSISSIYRARKRVELDMAIERRLRVAFASLPYAEYEDKRVIDLFDHAHRFASSLSAFVLYRLRSIFGAVFSLVVAAVAFWHFSPLLTLALFALTVPMVWFEIRMQGLRRRIWRRNTLTYRKAYAHEELVKPRKIKEVRLLGLVEWAIDKTLHYKMSAETEEIEASKKSEKYRAGGLLLGSLMEVMVLYRALQQIVAGQIPIGQFVFVQQIASQYIGSLREVSWMVQDMDELLFGAEEYDEIVNWPEPETGDKVDNPEGDIEFKAVKFTYPGADTPALNDISLQIPAGQTVAIVGENGAGKTTLVKLLMKLYDPSSGRVEVGGQSMKDASPDSWHKHLGVLFQDFEIFYDFTIRDNVWFGNFKEKKDTPRLKQSLEAADALDYVEKLPKGLETYLGKYMDEENGTDLSGGQSQRLAIARTLFRNPDVLILDEPTSAVDAKAEYKIFQEIEKARKGKTTILISHRFSTVRKANYIYVLEDGKLKEQGTHEQLMDNKSLYHEMFTKQAEGYR